MMSPRRISTYSGPPGSLFFHAFPMQNEIFSDEQENNTSFV